jgi:hypothetical protein
VNYELHLNLTRAALSTSGGAKSKFLSVTYPAMRTFFRLVDDVHIAERWHLGEVIENGSSRELWNGNPLEGGQSLGVTVDRPGKPLDFSLTSFAVPVKALGSHLNIQHFPFIFTRKAGGASIFPLILDEVGAFLTGSFHAAPVEHRAFRRGVPRAQSCGSPAGQACT